MTYVSRVAMDDILTLDRAVVRGSVSVARHDGLVWVMGFVSEVFEVCIVLMKSRRGLLMEEG